MRLLFDDLLELYLRYDKRVNCDAPLISEDNPYFRDLGAYWEDDDALHELGQVILEIVAPESIGQVMNLPERNLQVWGLIRLIEKDARKDFDQIDGYVDTVICEDVVETLTPAQYEFNGLDLCRWIDEKYPVEAIA